ncbi:MAG TPA: LysM peptidoglycan-binding domain-containing protein [Pyrinomonadaceae bacterium]|jgi:murein DD-endopeptidase MepM/ murein hydrolase activator NlpD|nr:LysM peptidoglycan-binding domain-containing protein [Pyrinomonadaceae bacterium]
MTYTVKAGDTLSKIAARNGLTMAQLLQANPQISDPNRINVGDVLNLPNGSNATENTRPLPTNPVASNPVANVAPPISTDNTQPLPGKPVTSAGALGQALADALGALSAKYETGGRGPGTVSTGAGDPGGVSYGSYQMATKMGTVARFIAQAGFRWAKDFQGLVPGTAQFTAVWKRIAAEQTSDFQHAQHSYIKATHYDLLCAKVLSENKVDINTRSGAVQDAVWSTAVQHGGATPIIGRAIATLSCECSDPTYDKQLICAIYAERGRKKPDGNLAYFSKSSPSVQAGVARRFRDEQADALAMLAKEV